MKLADIIENVMDQGVGIDKKRLKKMRVFRPLPGVPTGNNGAMDPVHNGSGAKGVSGALGVVAHEITDTLGSPEHSGARLRAYMGMPGGARPAVPSAVQKKIIGRPSV